MAALSDIRNTIADGTLLLIASTSIHQSQRFHKPMRSGMTSQKVRRRGMHGKSCTRTRTPRRKSIKLHSRGRTNLLRPMSPAPECPPAQTISIATQKPTSRQRTNSIWEGTWHKWKVFLTILLLRPPVTR